MAKQCSRCSAMAADAARFCGDCGTVFPANDAPTVEDDSWVALADDAVSGPRQPAMNADETSPPSSPPDAAPKASESPQIARGTHDIPPAPMLTDTGTAALIGPPRERRIGKALWIAAIVLGLFAAGLIVAWTVSWTRGPSFATVAATVDDPATPDEAWRTAYTDEYVGEEPVTMVTNASANVRNYPTTNGSQVLRSVAESSEIVGRWVRGRDPATRWLKLADGGYIWDGNLATRGGANSPIRIPFSNNDIGFGPDIDAYMARARADSSARSERVAALPEKDREQAYADLEGQSFYVRVPNRRWRGLTVTAVAQHYEAGSIYFREDEATARAAFRAAGIRFDNDGIIAAPNDEPVSCSIGAVMANDRQYGGSALTCGV